MKKIILSLLCLFMTGAYAQVKPYVVKGQLNGLIADGKYVHFFFIKDNDLVMDSAKVQNGGYTLRGTVDHMVMLYISHRAYGSDLKIFVAPAAQIAVTHHKTFRYATVTGSKANLEYNKVRAALNLYLDKIDTIDMKYAVARKAKDRRTLDSLTAKSKVIYDAMKDTTYPNYILNNPNSPIALALIDEYLNGVIDDRKLAPLYNKLSPAIKATPEGRRWAKLLATAQLTTIGKRAPDFVQPDTSGKPIKLSSLRGKYVLVDFWASWCGPCRAENPNVLKAYQKLKNKGFDVIGVSIDSDRKAWLKAIKEDGMPWIQVSDLKASKNEAAILYGVDAIPQNWLLDPNGLVVERNLRGEDLDEQIERLMAKQAN